MLRNAIALVEMEENGGAFGSFGSFAPSPTSAATAAGNFNAISRKSIVSQCSYPSQLISMPTD